jgi:hypothetical protein
VPDILLGWYVAQKGLSVSFLGYTCVVSKKRKRAVGHTLLQWYLGGKNAPPILKEEVWRDENGHVMR